MQTPAQCRLIALDLDGTLLRTDGTISARTRSALTAAERAGLVVMSVTARPPRRLRQVAQATGLRGLAICSNGGVIYDLTADSMIRQDRLAAETVRALIEALRCAAPGVAFAIEAGADYGCEPNYQILSEHPDDREDPRLQRADALHLCRAGVTKLIVQHRARSLAELLQVTREHAGALASVTHSGSDFVEVAAASVTKALALEQCCRELGVSPEQVIAFGDMPNDIPMLSWAGHAVAVANAHRDVLEIADEVTLSNDEDGVAVTLERFAARGYLLR
jgi:Cof subfamily protein (haloacid dehalogenase superfamily)